MPTAIADVIDLDQARCIQAIMERALREGTLASEVRTTLALALATGDDDVVDWDRYQAELEHLWALGAVDRHDFALSELH